MAHRTLLMSIHRDPRRGGPGLATTELTILLPFFLLLLVATSQIAMTIFRAMGNLTAAETTIEQELLRFAAEVRPEDRPCLEHMGGAGRRHVDRGAVGILSRPVSVPEEVTLVVDPICQD